VNFLRRLALQEIKLDDSSRLDVVEVARVPDMLPSLFPVWLGQGLISTPVVLPAVLQRIQASWNVTP